MCFAPRYMNGTMSGPVVWATKAASVPAMPCAAADAKTASTANAATIAGNRTAHDRGRDSGRAPALVLAVMRAPSRLSSGCGDGAVGGGMWLSDAPWRYTATVAFARLTWCYVITLHILSSSREGIDRCVQRLSAEFRFSFSARPRRK